MTTITKGNPLSLITAVLLLSACAPESEMSDNTEATMATAPAAQVQASVSEGDSAASGQVPGTTARDAIDAALEAMGGEERILQVRNITMMGYAHYAYQDGGGNITALPNAPQKYIQANDLRRIYDLENDRYYQQERLNDLFPFAIYRGHDFALQRRIMDASLDGAVAYNLNEAGVASRRSEAEIRELRMWMHTNPLVAVRAALDPENSLGNRREEGGLTLVDITLEEGDLLTLAIRPPTNLPAWIRWSTPQENLGEVEYTIHYSGFVPYEGVYLPLGYNAKQDWRDVEYLKMWVDGYYVDSDIQDLSAPQTVLNQPVPGGFDPDSLEVQAVARGIWRITGGTMVIEFADHMTLYEAGGGIDRVKAVVALARTIVPEKPVTDIIVSHHHFDHTRGLRQAIAEGLTVISRRTNGVIFAEMAAHPAPNFPDDLALNGETLDFIPVDDMMVLEDETMRVELYHTINNNHTADNLFAYVPEHKMIIEADVATAAEDLQWWGDSWLDNIAYRNLDVEINVPVHMEVMSYQEVIDMVNPGIQRVKDWCAEHTAEENFFPGCPAFLR
jgi:glyoxylase-like metal-dependent hydrolase (beta-lactamase superfamily II)